MNQSSDQPTIMHLIDSGGLFGAERMLLELATQTRSRKGWRVIVTPIIAPSDSDDKLGSAAEERGLEVLRFELRDGFRPKQFSEIFRIAAENNVSIIHSHGYRSNILCALQPDQLRAILVVCTLHGWTAVDRVSKMGLYQALQKCLLHRLDHVTAVSDSIFEIARHYVRSNRLSIIQNGISVNSSLARALPPECSAFLTGKTAILAAGRLSREKGFDLLVQAMKNVVDELSEVRLIIFGNGPEEANLQKLIVDLKLSDRVLLAGYIDDVSSLMHNFDVLVLSSRTEGLPLIILEAMSAQLPVVSFDVGGISAALDSGKLGVLVPPERTDLLARAVGSVLQDCQAARARAQRAGDKFENVYLAPRMEGEYCALYSRLLNPLRDEQQGYR